jgi:2-oxoisovalerate dehydrogenase E1 component alpha subunit
VTGTQTLHAVGAALAARLSKNDAVAVTTLGEGAASQGEFHEACNFAAVKRLPVIFVVESNGWAISEPRSEQSIVPMAQRAQAYGFPGQHVDGNDPVALVPALCEAVERARAGGGPTLIDAECVRITAHTSDDQDTVYRPPQEISDARECDPTAIAYDGLLERGLWDEERDQQFVVALRGEVDAALERAQSAPGPSAETLGRYVYAEAS